MASDLNGNGASSLDTTVEPVAFVVPAPGVNGTSILARNTDLLRDVPVQLEVRLGDASLTVQQLFELKDGSVVELARTVNDPVDLVLNGNVIARGQLVASGEQFGVRIAEIKAPDAS